MTRAKGWPTEADAHRRRAIKHARRILRLGDECLSRLAALGPASAIATTVQIHRWVKAIQTEMVQAKQRAVGWSRMAEDARMDTLVACNQMLSKLKEAEAALQKGQVGLVTLSVSQMQVHAQEIELMLSRVG